MPSQAYFEIDGVGDWYVCVSTAGPGQSPATHPEKWAKMEIARDFERYLVLAAASVLLVSEGQHEKGALMAKEADAELEDRMFENCMRGEQPVPQVMTR